MFSWYLSKQVKFVVLSGDKFVWYSYYLSFLLLLTSSSLNTNPGLDSEVEQKNPRGSTRTHTMGRGLGRAETVKGSPGIFTAQCCSVMVVFHTIHPEMQTYPLLQISRAEASEEQCKDLLASLARKLWSQGLRFLISKTVQNCDMSLIYILYMWSIKLNWYKFFGIHSSLYFTSGRNVLRTRVVI